MISESFDVRDESGIEEDSELLAGERAEEYHEKADRARELLNRIDVMIAVGALRRDGLHEEAEMFEVDEHAFGELTSRGYRTLKDGTGA
ncbi:hypothetical protein [Urbifossiella limnaea]|uniref:Uncharacterized protein n=1 Tax=Urbifossiella limnaea TaxID=2528023 RepID=A0A517XW37_9BACT|nr:hypothetical protein [Urbifossiella limnaea]QDU21723.1 hypothetical protein ETAA1_36960 [Urbifossiella limnaea]